MAMRLLPNSISCLVVLAALSGPVMAEPEEAANVAEEVQSAPAAERAAETNEGAAAQSEPEASRTEAVASPPPVVETWGMMVAKLVTATKPGAISREDRSALTSFYEARGEELLWVDPSGLISKGKQAIAEIKRADEWGLDASDFALPQAPSTADRAELAEVELKLTLAALKYARHARGGRMDPTDLSFHIDRKPPLLATEAVLAGLAAADAPHSYLRKLHPQHPQFEKLRQAYLAIRSGKLAIETAEPPPRPGASAKKRPPPAPERATARKVLHNMEQWRWMPDSLGETYVWANIPEFMVRVVRNGRVVHAERIVTGKPENQTPVFSDEMETIVFHPYWNVPDSIKVKEILPGLMSGGAVLERHGLRVQYRGREIDPYYLDWSRIDIRNLHIYQPPGGGNVLGVVKFLFPNKHQVYMHDTPTKNLFNAEERAFSHGCMRVRNPVRLAEILLEQDKGWEPRRVASLVHGGPHNNEIQLTKKIPVTSPTSRPGWMTMASCRRAPTSTVMRTASRWGSTARPI
jgi:murein L,D-transpeptidase YcbB/YkuD